MSKEVKNRIWILAGILVIVATFFMLYNTGSNLDYVLPKRLIRLGTIVLVGVSVGYSSLIFQTITNNRILTPSIMGYEAVFVLFQTVLVFIYGDKTFKVLNSTENFFVALFFMLLFSFLMYFILFKKGKNNIYHLLLTGLVLGILFETFGKFLQIIIDPNEFSMVESYIFASFNKINSNLLLVSGIITMITLIAGQPYLKYLNIIALGREQAINLGLNYNRLIQIYLLIISILVSVSTALVGPLTFIGILVTNLTYQLFKTYKHQYTVWICSAIACVALFVGQTFVEHFFNFSTTVSIVINFIGGLYFIYLILKSTQKK